MTRRLPKKDVVIVGLGWTGSILALELARAGLDVVAIERGPWRDTDRLQHHHRARRAALRHPTRDVPAPEAGDADDAQPARPGGAADRKFGSFLPPNGVGGGGMHWNGQTWRFLPDDFRIRTHLTERYGASFLPENNFIQDWPMSYDELEPYYDRFEKVLGVSGQAGNLKGQTQPGGNPFEGVRSDHYPTPPMQQGY